MRGWCCGTIFLGRIDPRVRIRRVVILRIDSVEIHKFPGRFFDIGGGRGFFGTHGNSDEELVICQQLRVCQPGLHADTPQGHKGELIVVIHQEVRAFVESFITTWTAPDKLEGAPSLQCRAEKFSGLHPQLKAFNLLRGRCGAKGIFNAVQSTTLPEDVCVRHVIVENGLPGRVAVIKVHAISVIGIEWDGIVN
jgi:hypothetical protein